MSRIYIKDMSFSYKTYYESVFSNVTLSMDTTWKLGIIGRNGRGKTTLLRLINGELNPDAGTICKTVNTEYFPYDYQGKYENTFDVIKECIGNIRSLEENLENPDILEKYMELDGFEVEGRIKRELKRIHLKEEVLYRSFKSLSGGEQTKALLIALFLKKNTFVLLDEPTNHLDVTGKEEVANYLSKKKGFILVSHEREFLDKTIDHVLAINKSNITIEKGNYSTWKSNFDAREDFEIRTRMNLMKEIEKLEGHAEKKREWAGISNTQKYHFVSNSRTNGAQSYMGQAKRAKKRIEQNILHKKKLLQNLEEKKVLEFLQDEVEDEYLIRVKNLNFSYHKETKLLNNVTFDVKKHDALWIKGDNGCGKSTLLRLITDKADLESITYSKGITFSVLTQEPVFEYNILGVDFLKQNSSLETYEESIRLCQIFDISMELLSKPCEKLSKGERKKIYLAKILAEKNNVMIMDEPLNYMDVMFREQLTTAIKELRPTLIFVEHDNSFGEQLATDILNL